MRKDFYQIFLLFAFVVLGWSPQAQPVPMGTIPENSSHFIRAYGDIYFFSGQDLWKSNGTEGGTAFLTSIGEQPAQIRTRDGRLEDSYLYLLGDPYFFFVTIDDADMYSLWVSDGTANGTQKVVSGKNFIEPLMAYDNSYYYVIEDEDSGAELYELNQSHQMSLVHDLNPGDESAFSSSGYFRTQVAVMNNTFYFTANDGSGNGLWSYDGTEVSLVKRMPEGDLKNQMAVVNNNLYFNFFSSEFEYPEGSGNFYDNYEIWKSDGTTEGTVVAADIELYAPVDPSYEMNFFTPFKGKLYFVYGPGSYSQSVWVSDGTQEGTKIFQEDVGWDGGVTHMGVANNRLYASGLAQGPRTLWFGDEDGLKMYKYESVVSTDFASFDEHLFYTSNLPGETDGLLYPIDPSSRSNLYITGLTEATDSPLASYYSEIDTIKNIHNLIASGNNLYYTTEAETGLELFIYDVSEAPELLADQFTLQIETVGQGEVSVSPEKNLYTEGEEVTITAVPEPGYMLSNWSEDAVGDDNPLVINIENDVDITASFKLEHVIDFEVQWAESATLSEDNLLFGYKDQTAKTVATDHLGNVYTFAQNAERTEFKFWVQKYSPVGNQVWRQAIEFSPDRYPVSSFETPVSLVKDLAVDSEGNVIVAGEFIDTVFIGDTYLVSPYSENEIDPRIAFVAKFNTNGELLWAERADMSIVEVQWNQEVNGIDVDGSGNVLIAGAFDGHIVFDNTVLTQNDHTANRDIFVTKYSPSGTVLWAKSAGGTRGSSATDVKVSETGDVFVTGDAAGNAQFGNITMTESLSSNFIAKYTQEGEVQWVEYVNQDYATRQQLSLDMEGNNIYASSDNYLAKYSFDGSKIWSMITGSLEPVSISFNQNGELYVSGSHDDGEYDNLDFIEHGNFVGSFDEQGNLEWLQRFGETNVNSVAASGSEIYIAGAYPTGTWIGDIPLEDNGTFVAKHLYVGSDVVTAVSSSVKKDGLSVFPNPSSGRVSLKLRGNFSGPAHIEVSDLSGSKKYEKEFSVLSSVHEESLDLSQLEKGVYLIRVIRNGQTLVEKLIIR